MKYIYSKSDQTADFLAKQLLGKLSDGQKILWLLSGGSGGDVCVAASKILTDSGISLKNLYVTMSDERYGELGHPNENWQILLDQGISLPGATSHRPLDGSTLTATTQSFQQWIDATVTQVDYTVALAGIGSDGHTFGAKPHTIATSSTDSAVSFQGDDFTRITITLDFARNHIDEAIVQAFGPSKHEIIQKLLTENGSIDEFPAQIYRNIPKVTIFSDLKQGDNHENSY